MSKDVIIPKNTAKAFTLMRGQRIRIIAQSIVDFVAYNLDNLKERFDQGRTKSVNGKIYISTGDKLMSQWSNIMLTIIDDTYKEGTHDLQFSPCSRPSYEAMYEAKLYPDLLPAKKEDLPDHGCWENLSQAVKPWKITPEEIPSPFNIFMTMEINGQTGKIGFSSVVPRPGTYVELRAEMNCLVALSACPNWGEGRDVTVQIYEL